MQVGDGQAVGQTLARLVGPEHDMGEAAGAGPALELGEAGPAADEEEDEVRIGSGPWSR